MENTLVTVIVCTHNPNIINFSRVLESLKAQTLGKIYWELIVVDNNSKFIISNEFDIGWHPFGAHIREDKPGLISAMVSGFKKSKSHLLIYVHDDTVLDSDYLEMALQIAEQYPILGTWGGNCIPEFEQEPSLDLKPFIGYLACRVLSSDSWSNFQDWCISHPFGAGMCVRRQVMEKFTFESQSNANLTGIGRSGNSLSSHEDYLVNRISCRLGLGCGTFQRLNLKHIIPAFRVSKNYIERLLIAMAYSTVMLNYYEGKLMNDPIPNVLIRWVKWMKLCLRSSTSMHRKMDWVQIVSTSNAVREIKNQSIKYR